MRVGIISLYHESNTFSPQPTTLENFRVLRLLAGPAAHANVNWGNHEVGGFIDGLRIAMIEVVSLFTAWAMPGGTITADAFAALMETMQDAVTSAGALDGYLVAPHGAAVAESHPDADGHWLRWLRDFAGPRIPIIGTLDPHANLSPAIIAATDALIAYRTNPHLDQRDRGLEAADLMARTLRGEIRPVQSATMPPVVINIERQHSNESPVADLEAAARDVEGRPGVLSASIILGFPYADVAEMGTSAIVVADANQALADAGAKELGDLLRNRRQDFVGHLISPADAIRLAREMPSPVCLLDMGDNVGGGSPGDGTALAHLLAAEPAKSFVCLYDAASATKAIHAGMGARLRLEMGGRSDAIYGPPLVADVTVRTISTGEFIDPRPRHGGTTHYNIGRLAVVETAGGLTVMLSINRVFPVSLVQLTSCGLDPASFRFIVAKGAHAPVTAYAEACRSFVRVNTPGITSADFATFAYQRRRRPLFPFEAIGFVMVSSLVPRAPVRPS